MLIIKSHYWTLMRQDSDRVFYASEISKRLQNGTLSIPPPRPVEWW